MAAAIAEAVEMAATVAAQGDLGAAAEAVEVAALVISSPFNCK